MRCPFTAFGLTALCLAAGLEPTHGAVRSWTGNYSVFWSNPSNWTNGLAPVPGDSIVFLEGAKYRTLVNDFPPDRAVQDIVFQGSNYTLQGNRLNVNGDIVSQPYHSTNRIDLDLNIYAPATIANQGYFNQLELGGTVKLYAPVVFSTISEIVIGGTLNDTNNFGSTFQSPGGGRLTVVPGGALRGSMTVDSGVLTFWSAENGGTLSGDSQTQLIIGNDTGARASAVVQLLDSERIGEIGPVTINYSGELNFTSISHPNGVTQTLYGLAGSGIINLGAGQLILLGGTPAPFSGDIQGTGTVQVGKAAGISSNPVFGSLALAGFLSFAGPLDAEAGTFTLTGYAPFMDVALHPHATLYGNGTARSLTSDGAAITLGPGALHLLDACTLSFPTVVRISVDGPNAGQLHAGSLDLGSADILVSYQGVGPEDTFTLATADNSLSSNFRTDTEPLPEAAWLIAGDADNRYEFQISYRANNGHDVVINRSGPYVPPVLTIHNLAQGERRLTWPLSAHDYGLQQATNLITGGWITSDLPAPATNATDHFVIDTNPAPARFYRLKR